MLLARCRYRLSAWTWIDDFSPSCTQEAELKTVLSNFQSTTSLSPFLGALKRQQAVQSRSIHLLISSRDLSLSEVTDRSFRTHSMDTRCSRSRDSM